MSVLVAVLITFGVLTKHNEITAIQSQRRQPVSAGCAGSGGGAVD